MQSVILNTVSFLPDNVDFIEISVNFNYKKQFVGDLVVELPMCVM